MVEIKYTPNAYTDREIRRRQQSIYKERLGCKKVNEYYSEYSELSTIPFKTINHQEEFLTHGTNKNLETRSIE